MQRDIIGCSSRCNGIDEDCATPVFSNNVANSLQVQKQPWKCTAVYMPDQHKGCTLPFSMLQQNWFPRWNRVQMSLESAMQLCYIRPIQANYHEQRQCKKCFIMGLLPYSTSHPAYCIYSTKSCLNNPYVSEMWPTLSHVNLVLLCPLPAKYWTLNYCTPCT
jgi:hypothetical protein